MDRALKDIRAIRTLMLKHAEDKDFAREFRTSTAGLHLSIARRTVEYIVNRIDKERYHAISDL